VASVPFVLVGSERLLPHIAPRLAAIDGVRSAVIVGASAIGRQLALRFDDAGRHGVRLLGIFDDRSASRLALPDGLSLLGGLDQVADRVRRERVGVVFIALPIGSQPRIGGVLESLRDTTASVYFVPELPLARTIRARIDAIDGLPVVALCESPFLGVAGLVKRAEDLVLGGLLLVLASPVMALTALAVRLSSPGPVIFRQRRYGLDGREIVVWKFRTMRVTEDGERIRQATRGDERITRVGAFLRKTSLDELPQLINVLQGRMSVVGPRPHAVAHNETYRRLIGGYMLRHKVRPGITGLAQVNGLRGETARIEQMSERVEYDLEYLRRWSLRLDLWIVLRTARVLAGDANAA
jgi:putative colanic acid biosynthesis UDP-glucose lipid carrier transferase